MNTRILRIPNQFKDYGLSNFSNKIKSKPKVVKNIGNPLKMEFSKVL